MEFDFETLVDRRNIGNMKYSISSEPGTPGNAVVLSGAEMDYATAPVIREALSEFAMRGIYGYTLPDEAYRSAICTWMERVRSFRVEMAEIVPTLGTIFALDTAVRAFTQPGDGVIVQHPSYYRYDVGIECNDRRAVSNPMKESGGVYSLDFTDLEAKMSDGRNKLLVLCNPHNPTGKVFVREDMERIAALARKHDVIVFSDEIFAEMTYEGRRVEPYAIIDPERGITSTSLGKLFNFTGVNHANLIIKSEDLRKRYLTQRTADHFGSIDPFFYCAVRAGYSEEGWAWSRAMAEHTWGNYCIMRDYLAEKLPDISLSPLEGGFVVWMDLRALGMDDGALERFLRDEVNVIADPGIEYGPEGCGFLRLNIATSREQIYTFLDNLNNACDGLRRTKTNRGQRI